MMLGSQCSPCCGLWSCYSPDECLAACCKPVSFTISVTASDYVRRVLGRIYQSRLSPGGGASPAYPKGLAVGFTQHWRGGEIGGTHTMLPTADYKYEFSLGDFSVTYYNDRCELYIATFSRGLPSLPGGSFVNGVAEPTQPPALNQMDSEEKEIDFRGAGFTYSCTEILNTEAVEVFPLRTDGGDGPGDPTISQGVGMGYLSGPTLSVNFQVRIAELYEFDARGASPPEQSLLFPLHYYSVASDPQILAARNLAAPEIIEEYGDRNVSISITPNF